MSDRTISPRDLERAHNAIRVLSGLTLPDTSRDTNGEGPSTQSNSVTGPSTPTVGNFGASSHSRPGIL